MAYRVEVEWSPAFELVVSLRAYVRGAPRQLELDSGWWDAARQRVGSNLVTEEEFHSSGWLYLFAWLCPEREDAGAFLRWLASLSAGQFYERLAPHLTKGNPGLPQDLGASLEAAVRFMTAWHEGYFQQVNQAILQGLEAEAVAHHAEAASAASEMLFERLTHGIRLTAPPEVERVLLVPQYHYRPAEIQQNWKGMRLCLYPADVLPPAPGDPPQALLRLTRALDDESRLRILRLLSRKPLTFTEVLHETGLTRGTVHHHLAALRAAGLIAEEDVYNGPTTYRLRLSALDDLNQQLRIFLAEAGNEKGTNPT
ncbi:MAG TPA: winged helix-turn-helix domain-containing protein [Ktedonobacterales bacterium]|jgi:DNA-binding transcriptional ArsR family regulator